MSYIKKLKTFLINGIILTITTLVMNVIGISFNVYISTKIGPEAVGLYQLIMSVYFFFITIATSGINLTATKIVSEELAKNKLNGAKIAIKKCIILSLTLGITSSILILLFSNFITTICLHNKIKSVVLYYIALALPFISMSASINGYFNAVRRVVKSSIVKICEQIVLIIITSFILNLLLPNGIEYACISLILGDVIAEMISFFILFILFLHDKSKHLKLSNNSNYENKNKYNYTSKILKITIPLALSSYIKSFLDTVKKLLIPSRLEASGLSCSEALAKYGILNGMVLPILMFPSIFIISFSSILIPEMAEYYATNNYTKIRNIANKIFKISFNFSFCMFGIFTNFSSELATLIYKNVEVGNILHILSPLVLFIYIDTVIDSILKGLNEQVNVVKCNIIDLFVSILCIYFLLPINGLKGYICVLFISEILNFLISMKTLIKKSKLKIDFKNWIIFPFIYTLFSSIIISIIKIQNLTVFYLIINIFIFIIIYLLFMILSKIVKSKLLFVRFK